MYEATVTNAVPTELKVIGNWPKVWLQLPKSSIKILRKLMPSEVWEATGLETQHLEISVPGNWQGLQVGDRVLVDLD
jgi:hypothetical protein